MRDLRRFLLLFLVLDASMLALPACSTNNDTSLRTASASTHSTTPLARRELRDRGQCVPGAGDDGVSVCVDCCFTANAKAQGPATALGKCNQACGPKGPATCFDACAADYTNACSSAGAACDAYDRCTNGCFLDLPL
jgi:hypothetical protein